MSGYTYMITNDDGEPLGFETTYPDEFDDYDTFDPADAYDGPEDYEPNPYDGTYSED